MRRTRLPQTWVYGFPGGKESKYKGPEARTGLASWRDLDKAQQLKHNEWSCDSWWMRSGRPASPDYMNLNILPWDFQLLPPLANKISDYLISPSLGFLIPKHENTSLCSLKRTLSVHTAIFKIHDQQGPTVYQREPCSVLCNNLNGKTIWKSRCMYMDNWITWE